MRLQGVSVKMSTNELPPNGETTIYNSDGYTCIPADVRRATGIENGDTIYHFYDEDEDVIKVRKVNDDDN